MIFPTVSTVWVVQFHTWGISHDSGMTSTPGVAQHKIHSSQCFGTLAVLVSVIFCLGDGDDVSRGYIFANQIFPWCGYKIVGQVDRPWFCSWLKQTNKKKWLLLPHKPLFKDDGEASPPQKCHVLRPHWDTSWVSVTHTSSLNTLFMPACLHNSGWRYRRHEH